MKMLRFQSHCFELKKGCSSFFKKLSIFQKICFKVKVLKTLKTSSDCQIKAKLSAILKISTADCEKSLNPFRWLQSEASKKKRSPVVRQKLTPVLHSNLLKRAVTFFKHPCSLIWDNGMNST